MRILDGTVRVRFGVRGRRYLVEAQPRVPGIVVAVDDEHGQRVDPRAWSDALDRHEAAALDGAVLAAAADRR